MARPYALLRCGFPYLKTIGMRRVTNFPADVAFGKEGRIYILCRGAANAAGAASIRVLNLDDENLGEFGSGLATNDSRYHGLRGTLQEMEAVSPPLKFLWPCAIIVDQQETLYVSDEATHFISMFNKGGEFLGRWGRHGTGDGELNRPAGIAFDSEENIYVVDSINHRVQKFTKDGKFITKWGGFGSENGEFNMPWGIAIDEQDNVYVADWRNDRVQKFSPDGKFIFKLGCSGSRNGEFIRPSGVAVDKDGDIYVADYGNNRVQLFNEDGKYVQQFIGDATLSRSSRNYLLANARPLRFREMTDLEPQKLFRRPRSVKVDNEGRMFVADFESYRVQVYQKEAIPLEEGQIAPTLRSPSLATV